jgi:hypothetical protein
MGAYTKGNAPAPENGDEVVAAPIAGLILRAILPHYWANYIRSTGRDTLMIIVLSIYHK